MIACVLPARLNSHRFPNKLLALAEGKTVLQHSYECALRAHSIDHLFIATDHPEIADHVHSFGGSVIWTSSHCASGTERIAEALQKEPKLQAASLLINLQADHPLTSPTTLDQIVALLLENPSTQVASKLEGISLPSRSKMCLRSVSKRPLF
jgi:3-deoxy-manno-octulosonate cytidylyltransferase (CMP-KDO synthetase)